MRALSTTLSVVLCCLGVAAMPAQTPANKLYDLYVESVLDPERFDERIVDHTMTGQLDDAFMRHLHGVERRLLTESAHERVICQQLSDPQQVYKCHQERPAAGMYFWSASLRSAINNAGTWGGTISGSSMIAAKRLYDALAPSQGMPDWAVLIRMGLQQSGGLVRAYLQ